MQVGTGNTPAAGHPQETQMQTAYSQAQTAQAAPQAQQAPVGSGGLRGMFTRGRAPGARDVNGRVLSDLVAKMNEYREKPNDQEVKGLDIKLIPIPRGSIVDAQFTNQISLLVFALGDGTGNKYTYHTLLIASEMPTSAPTRSENYGYNYEQVTAPRTVSAMADDALATVVNRRLQQLFPQAKLYSADWSQVPDGFRLNDPYAIEDLFYNSLRACWAELESKSEGFAYDSLEGAANDTTAIVSIHVNQDQSNMPTEKFDKVGNPIRAETLIDFRSEQPRTVAKDLLTENTALTIEFGQVMLSTTLMIDPVAARQSAHYNMGSTNGQFDTQDYIGEVTITGIDIYNKVDLGTVLLMISTALPLLDTNTRPWLRNFLPRHLQSNSGRAGLFRPRDLGALNHDYKWKEQGSSVVEPFNTNNDVEFGIDNFNFLTNTLIQPGVGLAIDVPECGDSTWYLRPFAEANDVPAAYNAIVKAANGLTGGRFGPIFEQTSRQITLNRVDRVLNGHFTADDGKVTDLRVIDMLYLMNKKGHINPNIGREWSATFGGSTDAQLAARAKLIEDEVASVTYTGVSIHKVFHPDFLISLDRAIALTGLKLRNELSREDSRLLSRHTYGLAQAGGLMTNFTPSMYTTGGFQNNGGGYRNMAHTRQY